LTRDLRILLGSGGYRIQKVIELARLDQLQDRQNFLPKF